VQQVNIRIPADLPAMQTYLWVCGMTAANPSQKVCSAATPIWLSLTASFPFDRASNPIRQSVNGLGATLNAVF
jgi:hypothetical protein